MVSAEFLLFKKGFIFTFLGCENDGVSCDSIFVLSVLTDFIRGRRNYTTHNDTNNDTKSSRYQLVVGGKNSKTIVIYIIDSGVGFY